MKRLSHQGGESAGSGKIRGSDGSTREGKNRSRISRLSFRLSNPSLYRPVSARGSDLPKSSVNLKSMEVGKSDSSGSARWIAAGKTVMSVTQTTAQIGCRSYSCEEIPESKDAAKKIEELESKRFFLKEDKRVAKYQVGEFEREYQQYERRQRAFLLSEHLPEEKEKVDEVLKEFSTIEKQRAEAQNWLDRTVEELRNVEGALEKLRQM